MTNKISVIVMLLVGIVGCQTSTKNTSSNVTIFNSDLKSAFVDIDRAINNSRNSIEFVFGVTASNCRGYLQEIKKSTLAEGVNNQIIHGEYILCETLDLLKSRNLVKVNSDVNGGEVIVTRLDLGSYPSSLYRMVRNQGKTLADFESQYLKVNSNSVVYETDDWIYSLELVATTDLNNDGLDDSVIWLHDMAKEGNYHTYTTLIMLNNRDNLLKAEPYSVWIRQ